MVGHRPLLPPRTLLPSLALFALEVSKLTSVLPNNIGVMLLKQICQNKPHSVCDPFVGLCLFYSFPSWHFKFQGWVGGKKSHYP